MSARPTVSLITASYNSIGTIGDAIDSVRRQTYPAIEYIVVDGLSTDGTAQFVLQQRDRVDIFISKSDRSHFEAFNRGIQLATGEVIGFVHSDDFLASPTSIDALVNTMIRAGTESVYGDLDYVNRDDPTRVVRRWRSDSYRRGRFRRGWMPPHTAMLIHKSAYERYGGFSLDFGTSADYELLLRFLYRYRVTAAYCPQVVMKMRVGGVGNRTLGHRWHAHLQDWRAWKANDLSRFPWWVVFKPLRKVPQFLA